MLTRATSARAEPAASRPGQRAGAQRRQGAQLLSIERISTACAVAATIAGDRDVDTLTEVPWAAVHGLITLSRNDRLRPRHGIARIDLLIAQFRAAGQDGPDQAPPGCSPG